MVSPVIAAAGISAGASLLGGLFANRSRRKADKLARKDRLAEIARQEKHIARSEYLNSPAGIRAEAEKAGFNPLVFAGRQMGATVGPTFADPVQAQPMSNTLANAVLAGTDAYYKQAAHEAQITRLDQENQRLQMLAEDRILTPKVGGIYDRSREASQAGQAHNRISSVSGGSGLRGGSRLGDSARWVAPGRDVKVEEYSSGSGLTEINNAGTGGPIVVPGSDGEPWGVDELATAVVFGAPQMAWRGLIGEIDKYLERSRNLGRSAATERIRKTYDQGVQYGIDRGWREAPADTQIRRELDGQNPRRDVMRGTGRAWN